MRFVVLGDGVVGRQVIDRLLETGNEAVPLLARENADDGRSTRLAEMLEGATAVIDATDALNFEEERDSWHLGLPELMEAEAAAAVGHHIVLSVVGSSRLNAPPCFATARSRERLVAVAGVPFTILRATQLFEDLARIADASTQTGTVHLSSAPMQPIASADVAEALVKFATASPTYGTTEIAGPERAPLAEFVGTWLGAWDDPRMIAVSRDAPYFGFPLTEMSLVPGADAAIQPVRLDDWLAGVMRPTHGW